MKESPLADAEPEKGPDEPEGDVELPPAETAAETESEVVAEEQTAVVAEE